MSDSSQRPSPDDPPSRRRPLIGVVGPGGSGNSTLIAQLEPRGYPCRHIAQEHSYVKDMWQRISHPDLLIFLDASFPISTDRRKLNWFESDHAEQQRRLSHARQHADLIVDTNTLTPDQVLDLVLAFLEGYTP